MVVGTKKVQKKQLQAKMKNHQQGCAYLTLPAHKRLYAVAQLTLPPQGGQGWLLEDVIRLLSRHTCSSKPPKHQILF